jgi:hypothetical protein
VGAILPGTRLVPAGSYFREGVEAHVREDGRVVVGSVAFDYPSGAARAAHRTSRALNGWWYWEIAGRGARLLHVRDEYAASRAAKKAEILARM